MAQTDTREGRSSSKRDVIVLPHISSIISFEDIGLNDEEIYYLNYLSLDDHRGEFIDDLLGKKTSFADLAKVLYDFFKRLYPEKDHGSRVRRINRIIMKAKHLYKSNMSKLLPYKPNHLMYEAVISDDLDVRPMLIQYRSIYGDLPKIN